MTNIYTYILLWVWHKCFGELQTVCQSYYTLWYTKWWRVYKICSIWRGLYSQVKTNKAYPLLYEWHRKKEYIRFCYFSLRSTPSWIRAKSDTQSSDMKICSKSSKHSELRFLYKRTYCPGQSDACRLMSLPIVLNFKTVRFKSSKLEWTLVSL